MQISIIQHLRNSIFEAGIEQGKQFLNKWNRQVYLTIGAVWLGLVLLLMLSYRYLNQKNAPALEDKFIEPLFPKDKPAKHFPESQLHQTKEKIRKVAEPTHPSSSTPPTPPTQTNPPAADQPVAKVAEPQLQELGTIAETNVYKLISRLDAGLNCAEAIRHGGCLEFECGIDGKIYRIHAHDMPSVYVEKDIPEKSFSLIFGYNYDKCTLKRQGKPYSIHSLTPLTDEMKQLIQLMDDYYGRYLADAFTEEEKQKLDAELKKIEEIKKTPPQPIPTAP